VVSFGSVVSAAMALISLGLLAVGAYLASKRGPLILTLLELSVGVLGLFSPSVFTKSGRPFEWPTLRSERAWSGLVREDAGRCGWSCPPSESLLVSSL